MSRSLEVELERIDVVQACDELLKKVRDACASLGVSPAELTRSLGLAEVATVAQPQDPAFSLSRQDFETLCLALAVPLDSVFPLPPLTDEQVEREYESLRMNGTRFAGSLGEETGDSGKLRKRSALQLYFIMCCLDKLDATDGSHSTHTAVSA